jgi:hypothetical protein
MMNKVGFRFMSLESSSYKNDLQKLSRSVLSLKKAPRFVYGLLFLMSKGITSDFDLDEKEYI